MAGGYTILGKHIPSHQLALTTFGLVSLLVIPNPFKSTKLPEPSINASNKEEEAFVKSYIKSKNEAIQKK
ncbi:uncharacterized protein SCODWIG_02441 [Saccharomycodes ludwigii]|uniref:ATP synthase subunit K, mitochondrial n=1 Tax=Saccharomycodes ludwigii TaxID=36035 RepID=A0A376B980_9ASCO|nr:hypothetical protein SCDLUD_002560 [Saccharomycodes ludwigii]KAH3901085.1 hypothetical protein SCDLUD_002560 [Saccharomycodes ludwigii]SSD60680.1 uncharacterized protein SCODWIG_02441 [Saccharomycodes ludwigii]